MKKIFNRLKYPIIIILFLIIVSISLINYQNTKEAIEDKYNNRNKLLENSIVQEIKHINDTYKIAEKQLNQEMKKYSLQLRNKYRQNPDIWTWNLEKLKEEFGGYNIYIIDENLKVVRTTFKTDKGLDFSNFPSFSKLLRYRLQGDSFAVDRLNLSTRTGQLKKYSYLPTLDHKYLLELGIDVKKKYPVLEKIDIFTDADDMTKKYESIVEILFYKFNPESENAAELRSDKKPYINTSISETKRKMVKQAYLSKRTKQYIDNQSKYMTKYIPALVSSKDSESSWWNSFVVSIKYDRSIMLDEISKHRNLFLINGLIMVVVFITFIAIVIYLLKEFEYLAYYDQLTGLAKRESFAEEFDDLAKIADKRDQKIAILFLDIDNFKEVNDSFGHDIGDIVLEKTASRLEDSLRKNDIVSRLGGDEFTIAINDVSSRQDIKRVVENIVNSFKEPLMTNNSKLFISISIGVSIYPKDGKRLKNLIKRADNAMYKAKKQRQSYKFYNNS